MAFPVWIDIGSSRKKETQRTPIVSIFGAGISGLSLAHELAERGMAVQVFEAREDPDEEYSCLVGGLAANQLARVPAHPMRLHPSLYNEQPGAEEPTPAIERGIEIWVVQDPTAFDIQIRINGVEMDAPIASGTAADAAAVAIRDFADGLDGVNARIDAADATRLEVSAADEYAVLDVWCFRPGPPNDPRLPSPDVRWEQVRQLGALREGKFERSHPRFPLPHRFQFEWSHAPADPEDPADPEISDWLEFLDAWGVANKTKYDDVWATLKQAYESYRELYARRRAALEADPDVEDFYLSERMRRREEICIEIRAYTEGSRTSHRCRARALVWAKLVKTQLLQSNAAEGDRIPELEQRLRLLPLGDVEPIGNPYTRAGRAHDNRVEVRIMEDILPAEHGYRYFPCFYRHLFDTMKRTPILDEQGLETGETAFDRLTPTPTVDYALSRDRVPVPGCRDVDGAPSAEAKREMEDPEILPTRAVQSLEEMRKMLRIHLERLNLCERDILQVQFRLLMFLTSSDKRRREYERMSWLEFLGADVPGRYSERMIQVLMDTPQALLAMDATETEAHTQGLIYCQLLLDALREGMRSNLTLSGPTSRSWLEEWKRYLRRQGVRFFRGELQQLYWTEDERLVPLVTIFRGVAEVLEARVSTANYVDMTINGFRISRAVPGLRPSDMSGLSTLLRDEYPEIEVGVPEPGDVATPGARFLVTARPRSALIQVGEGPRARLRVNGLAFDVPNPRMVSLRDAVLQRLRDAGLDAFAVGADALRLGALARQPDDAAAGQQQPTYVTVTSAKPGPYAIHVGNATVRFDGSERMDRRTIRDGLLQNAGDRTIEAAPVGDTGIRFGTSHRPHEIDVSDSEGRIALGPEVEIHEGPLDVSTDDRVLLDIHAAVGEAASNELVAEPILSGETASGGGPDFYVLAVPYEEASRLVWEAEENKPVGFRFEGVFKQLMAFDTSTGRRDADGNAIELERDAHGRPIPAHWPLRDLSGIQYYFNHQVRIGRGHTYFVDSPWGLSSISQLTYWQQRMSFASPFLGQVSVDLGNFYRAVERKLVGDGAARYAFAREAWHSTRDEIARETWRQMLAGIDPRVEKSIVAPTWYHLDDGLRFDPLAPDEDDRRAFSRPVVVRQGAGSVPPLSFELDGEEITAAGGGDLGPDLVADVEAKTDHLAAALAPQAAWPSRVLVAPVAAGVKSCRIVVTGALVDNAGNLDPGVVGVDFRVSVNLSDHPDTVASYTAVDASLENIRQGIVDAIMSTLPGVTAEPESMPHGEERPRGIRLASTEPMRVSVLAVLDDASLLWTNPTGGMELEPDDSLEVAHAEKLSTPIENATPFLINTPDRMDADGNWTRVWGSRPGTNQDLASIPDKGPYYYGIEQKRWLMVGNHMATHTRLSTMESANESARHAAIAILHALMREPADPEIPHYNGQGVLHGRTPDIWPPSEHEIDDALPFKRLDERLLEQGLPHLLEILKIGDWLDALPGDLPPVPDDERVQRLIALARDQLRTDWRFTQIGELEKLLPAAIHALLGG